MEHRQRGLLHIQHRRELFRQLRGHIPPPRNRRQGTYPSHHGHSNEVHGLQVGSRAQTQQLFGQATLQFSQTRIMNAEMN